METLLAHSLVSVLVHGAQGGEHPRQHGSTRRSLQGRGRSARGDVLQAGVVRREQNGGSVVQGWAKAK